MEDIDIIYGKYKEPDIDLFVDVNSWCCDFLPDGDEWNCSVDDKGNGCGSALGMGNEDGTGDGGTEEYKWYVYESYGWDIVSVNGQKTYDIDEFPVVLYSSLGAYSRGDKLNPDLTLSPCYAVNSADGLVCGSTLEEAIDKIDSMYEE